MKKLFTLAMLALMTTVTASAQSTLRKTWDFRNGFSAMTVNALKGDQEEFGDNKYWRNYESDATKADEQHFWCASKRPRMPMAMPAHIMVDRRKLSVNLKA